MNKFFLIGILIIFLSSCSSGKEEKIKTAVEKIEERKFKDNGEKIESLSIDSLRYEPASMQNFYSDQSDKQVTVLERYSERLQTVTDSGNSSTNSAIQSKAQRELDIFKQLQSLSLSADTTKNLYSVEYNLNAKTDKNNYQKKVQKYLYQKDLNEVLLDSRFISDGF
jgi:hypothetical protein